jgi:hypothetical protein
MTDPVSRRPLVGPLMATVGAIHVAITPVVYGASVRSVVDGGVVATIEAEPALAERRRFWYATAGPRRSPPPARSARMS